MKLPMWLRRDKALLVKTITLSVKHNTKKDGKIYIHLYESMKGKRTVEFGSTFADVDVSSSRIFAESTSEYQTQVVRWLSGRRDPNIPTYCEIPEEDTADVLRGKVL